jgi:hypothetical protein
MILELAPVCLFTYNRLEETKKTIAALQNNFLALETNVFIFSDAPKDNAAKDAVTEVRSYIKSVTGFKNITIIERDKNYGLAKSIVTGVTQVINDFGSVIVLEDDLLTSQNFLNFMNDSLIQYKESESIWSISGFSFPIKYPEDYAFDNAFGVRASSWGWATWRDCWEKVDWDVSDYDVFLSDIKTRKSFNRGGSDMCKMLNDQMTGEINSWAIRFCYAQFKNKSYDVFPKISKVKNIGFSGKATHTSGMDKRFDTILDTTETVDFKFSDKVIIEPKVLKQFRKPFSILTRMKYKLLRFVG